MRLWDVPVEDPRPLLAEERAELLALLVDLSDADLLRWSGDEVGRHHDVLDLTAPSTVVWAAHGDVPCWFDLARDLTERWVHQQHIRDAIGRPGDHARLLPRVLRTFVWAFPHQYRAPAPDGTAVEVDLDTGGCWALVRDGDRWTLREGGPRCPAARLGMAAPIAWRQLTGLPVPDEQVALDGDRSLVDPLLDVRGIIV